MTPPPAETEHDEDTAAFFEEIENNQGKEFSTCSASDAFNQVWQCYCKDHMNDAWHVERHLTCSLCIFLALRSQALNYYRYGSKKDCGAKYDDFKFCLSTKTKSASVADVSIKEALAWM